MADDFPIYEIDDLADFTGRPALSFPDYATEALSQAIFFIKLRTHVKEWPEDPDLQQAFKYAILDLADRMQLERQWAHIQASPLSSESIGSYSYSKSNVVKTALFNAIPTGIMWLDVLLGLLDENSAAAVPVSDHGSVHIFENDDLYRRGDGELWVLGPASRPERFGDGFGA